jgi:hypothetical protein
LKSVKSCTLFGLDGISWLVSPPYRLLVVRGD